MKVTWITFPKLIFVLPVLHLLLAQCIRAESVSNQRRKELELEKPPNVTIATLMKERGLLGSLEKKNTLSGSSAARK